MNKFPIIKKTPFTFGEGEKKQSGVAYVVTHKARVIQVSTLNFDKDAITEEGDTLNVKGEVELVPNNYTNKQGEETRGLKMVPAMDLKMSSM